VLVEQPLDAQHQIVAEHALSQRHGITVLIQEHYATLRQTTARTRWCSHNFWVRRPERGVSRIRILLLKAAGDAIASTDHARRAFSQKGSPSARERSNDEVAARTNGKHRIP
jgi:hypothetical protein